MFIFKHTLGSSDLLAGVTAPDSYSFLENSNLWKARGAVNGKNCLKKSLTMKREAKMLSLHNIPPKKIRIYYVGWMKRHFLTNYQPPGTRLLPKYLTYRSSN